MTSGVKEIVNHSNEALQVTLLGREGSDPQTPCDRKVTATIQAHQKQEVRYGDDRNPYLNGLIIARNNGSSEEQEILRVLRRGDAGTLDSKLNTHNTLEINHNPSMDSFTVQAQ